MRRHTLPLAALLPVLIASLGCEHHYFHSEGAITSQGGEYGTWQASPEGCIRDPAHDVPPSSRSVVTLVWRDMRIGGDRVRDTRFARPQNTPLRLELNETPTGYSGTLQTMFTAGATPLDASDCSAFNVSTRPAKVMIPGGRPTLDGTVKFECLAHGSKVHADLSFAGCEF